MTNQQIAERTARIARGKEENAWRDYEPTSKALAIAEIRHQTGLNYTECKNILDQIDNKGEGK